MKFYFVRHADTLATQQGKIQGKSDNEENTLTESGKIKVVIETLPDIDRILRSSQKAEIFIYSGTQQRISQTAGYVIRSLTAQGYLTPDKEHVIYDERLNGRDYGELEGENEAELRRKKSLITKPVKTFSYLLAQMGFKNKAQVEPKPKYEQKVFDFLYEMFLNHNGKNQIVFVFGNSDVFKALQRCDDIARMCYFGDEKIDDSSQGIVSKSHIKIALGEVKSIVFEEPEYDKSLGRFISVAEKYILQNETVFDI